MAAGRDDAFERGSIEMLRDAGIPYQEMSVARMKNRWPQINFRDIEWGIYEPECGYLDARSSCMAVVEAFLRAGGEYRQLEVLRRREAYPPNRRGIAFSDDTYLTADFYVFACGPWMGTLFPKTINTLIRSTKQDVFFFGTQARESEYFTDSHLPVWADHRDHFFYGIPGRDYRGFKVADDTRGEPFDPTDGERVVSPAALAKVREYVAFRFPALKDAPLIETRVCQYEQTPDSHFIIDRHPEHENVWLVGGGSGHGFKHGPAVGEMVADLILKEKEPAAIWRLSRFTESG